MTNIEEIKLLLWFILMVLVAIGFILVSVLDELRKKESMDKSIRYKNSVHRRR